MKILSDMSLALGVSVADLIRIARSAPFRYKVYTIPKRSGNGSRVIAQPAREVKILQRWLVEEISMLPVHECATAYKKGGSIKKNAEVHVNNSYLLKLDFLNFFPSIKPGDLERHFGRHCQEKYTNEEIQFISRILFWYPKPKGVHSLELCVGGPSSPFISNTIMFEFDSVVEAKCQDLGVRYTRYADDLALSTSEPGVLTQLPTIIGRIIHDIEYPRVRINVDKTVFTSRKHHRSITGVVLSSEGKISLGRARKRTIRAMINRFRHGELDVEESMRLRGLVAFAIDVEPSFIVSMERKYSRQVVNAIKRYVAP